MSFPLLKKWKWKKSQQLSSNKYSWIQNLCVMFECFSYLDLLLFKWPVSLRGKYIRSDIGVAYKKKLANWTNLPKISKRIISSQERVMRPLEHLWVSLFWTWKLIFQRNFEEKQRTFRVVDVMHFIEFHSVFCFCAHIVRSDSILTFTQSRQLLLLIQSDPMEHIHVSHIIITHA